MNLDWPPKVHEQCSISTKNGISKFHHLKLLDQNSPVPRARSSTAGKDATQAQIYASLGTSQDNIFNSSHF